jgi:LPXTG-motif cell wall-anchored protein
MIRKIGLGILLAAIATTASASTPQSCKIEWFWGFIPIEVCTPNGGIHKTPVAAPEIDPASAMAGLTLMAGGLAVLRGRRKKIIAR